MTVQEFLENKELVEKFKVELSKQENKLLWDYADSLNKEDKIEIIENGVEEFNNKLFYMNTDIFYENEMYLLETILNEFGVEYKDKNDVIEVKKYFEDYMPSWDTNLRELLSGESAQGIVMLDDEEGLYSNYTSCNYPYEYNGYFKKVIDALNLNPDKVERVLKSKGINVEGYFPNEPEREGKEYVEYKDFARELVDIMSECNFLTFLVHINLEDIYDNPNYKKVIILKCAMVGLYDPCVGSGSAFNMKLNRDMEVELGDFVLAHEDKCIYGVQDVYGFSDYAFGDSVILK